MGGARGGRGATDARAAAYEARGFFMFSSSLESEAMALCWAADCSDSCFKAGETDWRRRELKEVVVSDSRTMVR
jgi:hypothetical protein